MINKTIVCLFFNEFKRLLTVDLLFYCELKWTKKNCYEEAKKRTRPWRTFCLYSFIIIIWTHVHIHINVANFVLTHVWKSNRFFLYVYVYEMDIPATWRRVIYLYFGLIFALFILYECMFVCIKCVAFCFSVFIQIQVSFVFINKRFLQKVLNLARER